MLSPILMSTYLLLSAAAADPAPAASQRISRTDFNRFAQELWLPLYWREDVNENSVPDPEETSYLWGMRPGAPWSDFMQNGAWTPAFKTALTDISKLASSGQNEAAAANTDPETAEQRRRNLVREELSRGRPTLVEWDFKTASRQDRAVVRHIIKAAQIIEEIHQRQNGVFGLDHEIPKDDLASHTLFYRNQGPYCLQPGTEQNPDCHALPTKPERQVGIYPASLQEKPKFCEKLSKHKNANELTKPFSVIREGKAGLSAVPYHVAYAKGMKEVAKELKSAAAAISATDEKAFRSYLLAAAQAFSDNRWEPADEAWSRMNATNSKWYLRIGPDETYWEPCSLKAGFHVSFARINQASLQWQRILDPIKNDMEKEMAALSGSTYRARTVNFHLPDFIDIILNAGDSRSHAGATIGQSLPNWGPVANEGRGRTVAMSNLYTDADSQKSLHTQASSLFCPNEMKSFDTSATLMNNSTVLHEAAHNLGPAHEYRVDGKTDDQIFGGPLASMLEELKSQTAALYFTDWLVRQKRLDEKTSSQTHLRDIAWAFGHVAQGMYTAEGKRKAYSQLAAIQLGALMKSRAISWHPKKRAANGTDVGCFAVHPEKRVSAVRKLMKKVIRIKATGDKKAALDLTRAYVDDTHAQRLHDVIAERWLRAPKSTFVYSVSW